MNRAILPASALAIAAAAAPATASAKPPTTAHFRAYERAYHRVAHQLGRRVPGRNILTDGATGSGRPSDAQAVRSLNVLQRMLAPAGSSSAGSSAGAAGVPACASESGTDYSTGGSNTNASSGATGRYQITPGTAAAYGCDLSTAAGQDTCAAEIYQRQGAAAWVGCGG
jgi:hypothetical protein